MQKPLTALFVAIFFVPGIGQAADNAAEAIRSAEADWAKAVVAMDFAAMEDLYSDDLIYAHSTGAIESKAQYLDKLKSGAQKYERIDHEKTTVKTFGDSAVAHSVAVLKGTSKGMPFHSRLMMMHVWVRQNGHWRLAAHQTTKLEDL